MNNKRLAYIFLFCTLLLPLRLWGTVYSGACGDSVTWSLNTEDSILHLVGGGKLTAYANSESVPWDSLRSYIAHADIDTSITYLGDYPFYKCANLQELILPNNVTNVPCLRYCTSVSRAWIGDKVTSMGAWAFSGIKKLKYISWGASVNVLGIYVFTDTEVDSLDYRGTVADWCNMTVWYPLTSPLGDSTSLLIDGQLVDSLYIPDSVPEIKANAFYGYRALRYASFNEKTTVASSAFGNCYITIDMRRDGLPNVIGEARGLLVKTRYTYLEYHYSRQGRYVSFDVNVNGNVDMPNYHVGSSPWTSDYVIDSIYIPNGMTSIGSGAFANHTELRRIVWNNSINAIGDSAFYGCTGLQDTLSIPVSVDTVHSAAFAGCSSLPFVSYYKYQDIQSNAFPSGVPAIQLDTFQGYWQDSNNKVHYCLPLADSTMVFDGVGGFKSGDYPWAYIANKMKQVRIEGGITSIGGSLVMGSNSLESIYMCDSVLSTSNSSFEANKKLTTVRFSKNLQTIGWCSFYGCSSLKGIEIPSSVQKIDYKAFYNCSSISSIEFPSSIQQIGEGAFYGCTALTDFRYAGTVNEWIKVNLVSATANPCSYAQHIYFEDSIPVSEINFPDTVTSIGAYAFFNDTLLKQVSYYPSTTIGKDAFTGIGGTPTVKDVTAHGTLVTPPNETLVYFTFNITQQSTSKTVSITTATSATYSVDWNTGTATPVAVSHRLPLDEVGSVIVISIDPQVDATTNQTTYVIDVNVNIDGLPAVGDYPYTLQAHTQDSAGETHDYPVTQGIIHKTGSGLGDIYLSGSTDFFVPSADTDVYTPAGCYLGKWRASLPHGIYILRNRTSSCTISH